MDLYSGLPYWIVKNPLVNYYNPLRKNHKCTAAIIGSGITGALISNELCSRGIDCCVIDKRSISTGSSCASTALLQYEIDLPLHKMAEIMPEPYAVEAYASCLQAISDLDGILKQTKVNADFQRVPSVFYSSNRKGAKIIEREYEMRKKYQLPVEYLDKKQLFKLMEIKAHNALFNNVSAQIDTYKASTGLLAFNMRKNKLKVFSHTEIKDWQRTAGGYILTSSDNNKIECDYVIVATGFEASDFLPEKLMKLTTTFAIISEPIAKQYFWHEQSLIWETQDPYLYIRTDGSRIIIGGEDIDINSTAARKFLLDKKAKVLEKKFRKLFPHIPFKQEMAWAGTFSSTKDGLPIIGSFANDPHMLYALGYGGNGITFSVIASQILSDAIQNKIDERSHIFSPARDSLK